MNNFELIITEQAYLDIENIIDYIAKDNLAAAKKTLDLLFKSCFLLSNFPDLGSKKYQIENENILLLTVKKRYIIAYKIQNKKLIIVRILSSYQDIIASL